MMSVFDRTQAGEFERVLVRAISERDPELFASLYTESASIYPSDGGEICGRSAIAGFFGQWLEAGLVSHIVADVQLTVGDTVAVEDGVATAGYADGSMESARYLIVHVRQGDGKWLADRDIWTQGSEVRVEARR